VRETVDDAELTAAGAVAGGLLYVLVAVLAAVLEVLLVPVRLGTVVLPVSVVLAVVTTVVIPILAGTVTGRTAGAALPLAAWIITVVVLSQARREGDVLLVGSAPLVYVTYAMLGLGAVSGIATVLALDKRRLGAGGRPAVAHRADVDHRPASLGPTPRRPPSVDSAGPRREAKTGPATARATQARKRRR
jgi:hypothetical protein